jgi:hypothetical protein
MLQAAALRGPDRKERSETGFLMARRRRFQDSLGSSAKEKSGSQAALRRSGIFRC